jgi:NAD(P)-dependent dehydrogenase (short-subunit alcohol dehydrogenase family)
MKQIGTSPEASVPRVEGRLCEGRICIVTGAGRGIGRRHALTLAGAGAKVLVNDVGANTDGSGVSTSPAEEVVAEIRAAGGEAEANGDDVSSWEGAQRLVNAAVESFGDLHVVVNNAGILRDRMLVNMTEDEWDAVIRVHLKGTFNCLRWAAAYWRERVKAGATNDARVINTTSGSGLFGTPGQGNYGAAKAAIAGLTIIGAMELARYGITVNAISPIALTRMTEGLELTAGDEAEQDKVDPRWISPVVAWLASARSKDVTGRVFQTSGRYWAIAQGWRRGPEGTPTDDPDEAEAVLRPLLDAALPNAGPGGVYPVAAGDE